jgi:Xaa-Pro aminopeptidase
MLEVALREGGAESPSFPIIVAAGPNAALPHHRPGDDALGVGRPIVIDMGARLDGYHADLTRTVALGAPDARLREVYAIVHAAQRRAIAGLRPGLRADEADALARDHIAAAGFGDNFGHGLGHGVGPGCGAPRPEARARRSRPAWSPAWSRASTSRAGAACGSRTWP